MLSEKQLIRSLHKRKTFRWCTALDGRFPEALSDPLKHSAATLFTSLHDNLNASEPCQDAGILCFRVDPFFNSKPDRFHVQFQCLEHKWKSFGFVMKFCWRLRQLLLYLDEIFNPESHHAWCEYLSVWMTPGKSVQIFLISLPSKKHVLKQKLGCILLSALLLFETKS